MNNLKEVLFDDVSKWGVEHTGNEPSLSCFYRAYYELQSYVLRLESKLSELENRQLVPACIANLMVKPDDHHLVQISNLRDQIQAHQEAHAEQIAVENRILISDKPNINPFHHTHGHADREIAMRNHRFRNSGIDNEEHF